MLDGILIKLLVGIASEVSPQDSYTYPSCDSSKESSRDFSKDSNRNYYCDSFRDFFRNVSANELELYSCKKKQQKEVDIATKIFSKNCCWNFSSTFTCAVINLGSPPRIPGGFQEGIA